MFLFLFLKKSHKAKKKKTVSFIQFNIMIRFTKDNDIIDTIVALDQYIFEHIPCGKKRGYFG